MPLWLSVLTLALAALAMHWGAERFAQPLRKLRDQWGFSPAVGGTFVGIAAASPEILINVASVAEGVTNIGLGAQLGSNIFAMPLIVTVTYLATRREAHGRTERKTHDAEPGLAAVSPGRVPVVPETLTVQVLPYLGIIALVALLTIPAPLRGLQPIDGLFLGAAYAAYLTQAIVRKRRDHTPTTWRRAEIALAAAGVGALALGAYLAVRATESLADALGLSQGAGGLLLMAPVAALPEIFAAWSISRKGLVTAGVTSVVGDNAVTLTLAFLPLAFIGTEIADFGLFCSNLGAIALLSIMYAGLMKLDGKAPGFGRLSVIALDAVLAAYLVFAIIWAVRST